VLTDHHTGASIEVELDPQRDAAANADAYFRRARRAERAGAQSPRRRQELEKRKLALHALLEELNARPGAAPDRAWFERADRLGVRVPGDEVPAAEEGPDEPAIASALRPRRYPLEGGWEVLVGKSNRGNELLTFEIARPHDLWMHADQVPGSHVVLRHQEKGREAPREIVAAAAAIAAHFSKGRTSGKVPVIVTERRHVQKPRRAPAGTVTVGRHRSIMVAPQDPDRTKR
jgi:predicted ribosome quality control (RQC) complex YloA/Tae2 family protein